jgi:hypothetical protein
VDLMKIGAGVAMPRPGRGPGGEAWLMVTLAKTDFCRRSSGQGGRRADVDGMTVKYL